jgi:hypothetical protein
MLFQDLMNMKLPLNEKSAITLVESLSVFGVKFKLNTLTEIYDIMRTKHRYINITQYNILSLSWPFDNLQFTIDFVFFSYNYIVL